MIYATHHCSPIQVVFQSPHFNILLYWIVHNTPSGYMDRDGWLNSITQFFNVYGASPYNNQILFFDGHNIHFDNGTLWKMVFKSTQPFVLKSCDSINDQPNDNCPNSKLKSLYNAVKNVWMMKYGTKRFLSHHMSSVLVEAWDTFNVSSGNIIGDGFSKTILPPLFPLDLTTKTQACATSVEVSYGPKAE